MKKSLATPRCRSVLVLAGGTSFHRAATLRTVPLALRRGRYINARIVEPLEWTVFVVAGHHIAVGNLIANAVTRFVRIVGPLTFGCLLDHHAGLVQDDRAGGGGAAGSGSYAAGAAGAAGAFGVFTATAVQRGERG